MFNQSQKSFTKTEKKSTKTKTFLPKPKKKSTKAKSLLFIVHRETIAMEAMRTFKMIFKGSRTYGVYSGGRAETNAEFIFSTVQTFNGLAVRGGAALSILACDTRHLTKTGSNQNLLSPACAE